MSNDQYNPLLARSRRNRGLIVSLTAGLGILAAGTIAVSAKTSQQFSPTQVAQVEPQTQSDLRGSQNPQTAQVGEQRRQVRVIPLFNTPVNPTGK